MGDMVAVTMVTIDCEDPRKLAEFWTAALGTEIAVEWEEYIVLKGTPAIGLQRVESPTPGKNRLHLDLSGGDRAPEVARLVELGADVVRTHDVEGFGWTVMVDPAGNEFCVSDPHGGDEGGTTSTDEDGAEDFDAEPDVEGEDSLDERHGGGGAKDDGLDNEDDLDDGDDDDGDDDDGLDDDDDDLDGGDR